jgi:glycolate oxidase FAD binding subunit
MGEPFHPLPRDEADLAQIVGDSFAKGRTIEVRGTGTKSDVGPPVRADQRLDLESMRGVVDYDPGELVLTVRAGARIAEIDALLSSHRQMLAFEPVEFGLLRGDDCGGGTLGGVLAANLSGPRRLVRGSARDHFLGFRAVSGRGEVFKAGGKVVKNVTGYDLPKLMAGSWGTLAVLTELSVRVVPRPRCAVSIAIFGLSDREASLAMRNVLGSAAEVSGAAHVPERVVRSLPVGRLAAAGSSLTLLRLEGFETSVKARVETVKAQCRSCDLELCDEAETKVLWPFLRDAGPLARGHHTVWRISTPPTEGMSVAESFSESGAEWFFDWAGGLVWLAVPSRDDAFADAVRKAVRSGHGRLVRATFDQRLAAARVSFEEVATARLDAQVKAAFDPGGVLNPRAGAA